MSDGRETSLTPSPSREAAAQSAETAQFLADLRDLFLRRRAGHTDYWTYGSPQSAEDPVRGDEHWERFASSHRDYYVREGELALIERFAADVARQCNSAPTLLDLGPGSLRAIEAKTLPFLRHLPALREYHIIDASVHFRQEAQRFASEHGLSVKLSSQDFWSALPHLAEPAVLMMMGGTISNICPADPSSSVAQMLTQALRHLRQGLRAGGWLLFVYDSNQDERSLRLAYDHPDFHQFNFSVLHRAVRDLPITGLDTDAFFPGLTWCAPRRELQFFVETRRAIDFSIAGTPIKLAEGERFHLVSAYKYPHDLVAGALAAAGWHSAIQYQLLGNPMVLCLAWTGPA